MIGRDCVEAVLDFEGEGGLRAELTTLGSGLVYVETSDEGCVLDVNDAESFERLTAYLSRARL